jgi:serine phosphatase RsbU (regulator of sigma subunit)
MASGGQPAGVADLPVDPPVGVSARTPRRATALSLLDDTVLCLFTDGLVERRGESIDRGLELLAKTVRVGHPDALCATIMATMVGQEAAQDDIALLALRLHGGAS